MNDAKRPGDPETVGRICDFLGIRTPTEKHALFAAAGYAYSERPVDATQPIAAADLAAYLEIVRTKHRFLETRGYRNLDELRGPPIRLPILDESGRAGVYTPLRYDLQLAREETDAFWRQETASRTAPRQLKPERETSRTDVDLREVLATPDHLALIGKAGCGKTTVLRLAAAILAEQDATRAQQ